MKTRIRCRYTPLRFTRHALSLSKTLQHYYSGTPDCCGDTGHTNTPERVLSRMLPTVQKRKDAKTGG